MNPDHVRTAGELVFEAYLTSEGFVDFEHEKQHPQKNKRPDYTLSLDREYLFEVKDFEYRDYPVGQPFAPDSYKHIREKINQAGKKFKEYASWPCCLVMFNNGDPFLRLKEPEIVIGAMEGDLGAIMLYKLKGGGLVPNSMRYAFLDNGKMIRPHWTKPQYTKISALITLRYLPIGALLSRKYFRDYQLGTTEEEKVQAPVIDFDEEEKQLGVIVWENRFAELPFPRELFCGCYDERYGLEGDTFQRIYAGNGVLDYDALHDEVNKFF